MTPTAPNPPALRLLMALALCLFFNSCEESEHLYILNPDGSGRVTAKEKFLTSNLEIKGQVALTQAALTILSEFVTLSEGVDAWEKMSYTITASGDLELEATALFSDLSKLKLASTALVPPLAKNLKFDKGGEGRPASIELASPITAAEPQKVPAGAKADDKAVATELAKTRNLWLDAEANIRPEYGEKKAKVTFHVGGEIQSQSNFKKDAKNQVSLQVSAPQVLDTLEKVIASDEISTGILKTGAKILSDEGAPPIPPDTFNELTFGEAKPIRFEFAPGANIFDYASALDAAREAPGGVLQEVLRRAKAASE